MVKDIETRKKISDSHKGNKSYLYGRKGKLHNTSIPVLQINLNDKIITKWESMNLAQSKLKIMRSHISEVCNGKRKSIGGFKWKFANKIKED